MCRRSTHVVTQRTIRVRTGDDEAADTTTCTDVVPLGSGTIGA